MTALSEGLDQHFCVPEHADRINSEIKDGVPEQELEATG